MSHISLKAKVLEIPTPKLVFTRFGNYASVVNALIADETGTIKLCLWNEQIDSISNGDTIQIENARASTFKGERQLSIGKRGTLNSVVDLLPTEESAKPTGCVQSEDMYMEGKLRESWSRKEEIVQ
jgi:replication factor A1